MKLEQISTSYSPNEIIVEAIWTEPHPGADDFFDVEPDLSLPVFGVYEIRYEGSDGSLSDRVVTAKHISRTRGKYFLAGWCHMRKAPRTFSLDGIQQVIDVESGEVLEDPYEYMADKFAHTPAGAYAQFFYDHQAEVIALMYMARCDGRLSASEREVVLGYVQARMPENFDREVIEQEIKRFHCQVEDYEAALRHISGKSAEVKLSLSDALEAVMLADGKKKPEEIAALEYYRKNVGL